MRDRVIKPLGECEPDELFELAFRRGVMYRLVKIRPMVPGSRRIVVHVQSWNTMGAYWNPERYMVNYPANEPVEIVGDLGGGIEC